MHDQSAVKDAAAAILNAFGRLDAAVNAGITVPRKDAFDIWRHRRRGFVPEARW